MKLGDIIEVHQVVAFGPDKWIAASVVSINPNGDFGVQAIKGTFDGEHDLLMLPADGNRDRMWRQSMTTEPTMTLLPVDWDEIAGDFNGAKDTSGCGSKHPYRGRCVETIFSELGYSVIRTPPSPQPAPETDAFGWPDRVHIPATDAARVRDEALEEAARLHESVDPASDAERIHGDPGAGAMGAVIEYRDKIRALKSTAASAKSEGEKR